MSEPQTPRDELARLSFEQHLPAGYESASAAELTFDPRLAFELAVGVSSASATFAKYGFSEPEARALLAQDAFKAKLREYKDEITKSGYGFRLRAKIQAEDLLTVSYALIQNPHTPAPVRAVLIKWTARVADLEPAQKDAKGGAMGSGPITLSISFHGQPAAVSVDSGPTRPAIDGQAVEVIS